jgi:hypothetical protein
MTGPTSNTFTALFTAYFGQLVLLIRRQPGDKGSQKNALRSAMAVLPRGEVLIEAGIEYSDAPDDNSLKGRLLSRLVDSVKVSAEASAAEVLALARALASDQGDIPSTPLVQVERVPAATARSDLTGSVEAPPPLPEPLPPPAVRHRTMAGPVEEAETLARALRQFAAAGRWMEAIHAGQAMVQLTVRFPLHEQRGHVISLRRSFTRPLLEQFIAFALRVTEEQGRVSEILQHAGAEGIELMVDNVKSVETVGPRRFVHDVLATTPAALPMLIPLLSSARWHEVRHGAELLGRLGLPEAIEPLRAAASHPDERVRKTVIEALGRFHTNAVIEPLRRALSDPAPVTRASAAHALSQRRSPGLALPILVALEAEKDPMAWEALVVAVARIDSFEAVSGLVEIALDKRPLFQAGRPKLQRLTVISALRTAGTASARRGLERLAGEADAQLRRAAAEAIEALNAGERPDPQRED